MYNKTSKAGHTLQFLAKDMHMKRWLLGFMLILMLALATIVFAAGYDCATDGPPLGGPGTVGPRGPGIPYPAPCGIGPQGPGMFHGRPEPRFFDGIGLFKNLKLTTEQIEQLKVIADRTFVETKDLRYQLSLKHLEMQKLFSDPKTDEATLRSRQKELNMIRQKMMDIMDQKIIEARKILKPDQIQRLDLMPPFPPPGMGH